MGSIIAILLFSLSLIFCLLLKLSVVYALIIGYMIFVIYGLIKGHNLIVLIKKSFDGILIIKNILLVLILESIRYCTYIWTICFLFIFSIIMEFIHSYTKIKNLIWKLK